MSETIWVSDSDCCEMCDGLLDYFGQCPHCRWDSCFGWGWDDTDEEDFIDADTYDLDFDENGKYIGG